MAKASAVRGAARRLWAATANPDGPGLLERGREFEPTGVELFDPVASSAVVRLARLSARAANALRDCPDPSVRRSAAVLAARGYPILAAFDVNA